MNKKQTNHALPRRALKLIQRAHTISGLSIRAVAAECYLDHSYVAQIKRGRRHPRRDTLLRLCQWGWRLGVDTTDAILIAGGYAPLTLREKLND